MFRKDASARPGSDRANLYDDITGKIIAELEAGRFPWVQPWGSASVKAPLAMPRNAATGRQYSGINVLILWGAVIQHGFPGQSWLTFRQALAPGSPKPQRRRRSIRGVRPLAAEGRSPWGDGRPLAAGWDREGGAPPFGGRSCCAPAWAVLPFFSPASG